MYLNKIIKVMKNDFPVIKNLKLYGFYEQLSEEELIYVFSGIFEQPVTKQGKYIYSQNGNEIYIENSYGIWIKSEYDNNGNEIYHENSNGDWIKREYDDNGNEIYYEDSNGYIEDNR